jgi:predicted nucleotidyltransferase
MSTTPEQKPNKLFVTQSSSSDSVRITWFDRSAVLEQVRWAVAALASRRPEVERVLLFGSLAAGHAVPGSDVDLLVVLEQSATPFVDRIPLYMPEGCGVGVDVFPYTQQELARMQAEGNSFLRSALRDSVVLFSRRPQ